MRPPTRSGDYEEIMNKVTVLSVLSNAVLVWNTVRIVATGERGYQIHRRHRYPGTHPVARRRFFALTVPRRHARELELAVRAERSRA
jgi:hypothetical protein